MNNEPTELDMEFGSGIAAFESRHFSIAAGLLSPLAEAGNPQAQYRMAIMAQNGLGMHENQPLAFKYMRAAAEAGLDVAQHGLGFMYMEGECTFYSGCRSTLVKTGHAVPLVGRCLILFHPATLFVHHRQGRPGAREALFGGLGEPVHRLRRILFRALAPGRLVRATEKIIRQQATGYIEASTIRAGT